MSQTRPFRETVNWIKGDTLQYSFTFNEDDSPLDLTSKDEITVILRNKNSTIFTHTVTGGELTISPNNKISGEASATVMDIANRSYDLIIYFDNDIKQTWVMFDVKIFDEHSKLHSSASDWTIDIDTTAGTVSGQATQQIRIERFAGADYVITKSGNTYYATSTTLTNYSGSDFATILQSAIDEIPSYDIPARDSGGIISIFIPAEEQDSAVSVTKKIIINKRILLKGLGNPKRSPVLSLANGVNDDMFLIEGSADDAGNNIPTIENLRLHGNKDNQTEPCSGIKIGSEVNEFNIKNTECTSFSGYGIDVSLNGHGGGSFNTIQDCFLVYSDLGQLNIESSLTIQNLLITNNFFDRADNSIPAIKITRTGGNFFWTGCIISDNIFQGCCLEVSGNPKNWAFVNNVCRDGDYIVKINDAPTLSSLNAVISDNFGGDSYTDYIIIGENNNDIQVYDNAWKCTFEEVATISGTGTSNVLVRHKGETNFVRKQPSIEITENGSGITLLSPNGTSYVLTVDNDGNIVVT